MKASVRTPLARLHSPGVMSLVAAILLSGAPACSAEDWPKRFTYSLAREGSAIALSEQTAIVLYQDGRAEFSSSIKRKDGSEARFVATTANWTPEPNGCMLPPSKKGVEGRLCIRIEMSGLQDGEEARYAPTYILEAERLIEVDKTGVQETLFRVHGPAQPR